MGFLASIGDAIASKLIPIVSAELEKHGKVLIPKVIDTISDEIEKRIPALTAALVTAVTQAVGNIAVEGVDKVTDLIPGQLDDQFIDPIVKSAMDIFKGLLPR